MVFTGLLDIKRKIAGPLRSDLLRYSATDTHGGTGGFITVSSKQDFLLWNLYRAMKTFKGFFDLVTRLNWHIKLLQIHGPGLRWLEMPVEFCKSWQCLFSLEEFECCCIIWRCLVLYGWSSRHTAQQADFFTGGKREREREMCFYVLLKPLETLTSPDRDQASNVLYHISCISPATHGTFLWCSACFYFKTCWGQRGLLTMTWYVKAFTCRPYLQRQSRAGTAGTSSSSSWLTRPNQVSHG